MKIFDNRNRGTGFSSWWCKCGVIDVALVECSKSNIGLSQSSTLSCLYFFLVFIQSLKLKTLRFSFCAPTSSSYTYKLELRIFKTLHVNNSKVYLKKEMHLKLEGRWEAGKQMKKVVVWKALQCFPLLMMMKGFNACFSNLFGSQNRNGISRYLLLVWRHLVGF